MQLMIVKETLVEVVKLLNGIDEYDSSLSDKLSLVDSKICDLLHLIENNTLKTNQCYRIIRELHNLRIERRKIKNDMEILKVYREHKQKLLNYESRKFIIYEIGKKLKQLDGVYKNRVYTEEELKEMVGV